MASHVLTSAEMQALGDYIFRLNSVSGTDTISSTGHSVIAWTQEINDALRCVAQSIFGHSYENRLVMTPFPPKNMDGEIDPPGIPSTAILNQATQSFIGFDIEV